MFPTNLNVLGLSPEVAAERLNVIGGSDAKIIMGQDQRAITQLWKEKRGEAEHENLDDVIIVQLGYWTEPFNRLWFEKQTGTKVIATPAALEMRYHRINDFMACNVDGLVSIGGEPGIFEAKNMIGFATDEEAIEKYYPQMQHNIETCNMDYGILSVIFGNHRYQHFRIERDVKYVMEMVKREQNFIEAVRSGRQPTSYGEAPAPKIAVDTLKIIDKSKDNEFVSSAVEWVNLAPAVEKVAVAIKVLKAACDHETQLVFAEVIHPTLKDDNKPVKVTVAVRKNANGALSLREANKNDLKKIAEWREASPKEQTPKAETSKPAKQAPVKKPVNDDDL